jgi:hypothetical protein
MGDGFALQALADLPEPEPDKPHPLGHLLFGLMMNGKRYVCYEAGGKYHIAGGPYNSREAMLAAMPQLRLEHPEEYR